MLSVFYIYASWMFNKIIDTQKQAFMLGTQYVRSNMHQTSKFEEANWVGCYLGT